MIKLKTKENLIGICFLLPFLIGFTYFFIYPFCISIYYSMIDSIGNTQFVWFNNYIKIFSNAAFLQALFNTLKFIAIGLPIIIIVSMGISMMLEQSLKGAKFFRSIFLYPLILPVSSIIMFFRIFLEENGILNSLISIVGGNKVDFLYSSSTFYVLVFLFVWKNAGYNIVLLTSAINSVPKELYEAAKLDGASYFKCFRYITLPYISPTLSFTVIISIVNLFKSFREAFLLGGQMPHPDIYMLQHFMNNNFDNLNYQHLSVAAFLIFSAMLVIIVLYFQFLDKSEDISI